MSQRRGEENRGGEGKRGVRKGGEERMEGKGEERREQRLFRKEMIFP